MEKRVFGIALVLTIFFLVSQVNAQKDKITLMNTSIESIDVSEERDSFQIGKKSFAVASVADDLIDDDAVMGNPNALVTMVEFGGFEETFSRRFWSETFPTIKSEYIDTGKIKYVFRDFPLASLFPNDGFNAVAAECVHLQGGDAAYFQMWNALYSTDQVLDEDTVYQLALDLGYDIQNCLNELTTIDEVVLDVTDATLLGVEGSPTFFINERIISGVQPYEVFQGVIEQELNKTIACFNNGQCNDTNPYTFDTCVNPRQLNAECRYEAIRCLRNSDCGNSISTKFCSNNALCTRTLNYECSNAGKSQASCSSSAEESCNNCLFGCNNQTLACKADPIITIHSPLDKKIYNTRAIQFNLTTSNYTFGEISYIDRNETRPRWTILCKNCIEYGWKKRATKSFDEGAHNLTFEAINGTAIITKNVSFFIDTKEPRISKTLPRGNGFTNGSNFYIKYSEDNCKLLSLVVYNNTSKTNSSSSCVSGKNIEKYIKMSLSSYNNKEVEYQFVISDIANNTDSLRPTKIKVDTTHPRINSFVNTTNGRRVTFTLNITELNFDEVNYIDWSDLSLKTKTLCSSLRNGLCSSTKTFKPGYHNLTINVLDKAGNSVRRTTNLNL